LSNIKKIIAEYRRTLSEEKPFVWVNSIKQDVQSSCIYTVHLTRSLNRQTNTWTLLFIKTYL